MFLFNNFIKKEIMCQAVYKQNYVTTYITMPLVNYILNVIKASLFRSL